MFNGEQPWFAVLDWLETTDPVKFQWLAHAYEPMNILPSEPGFDVSRGPARLAVRFAWPANCRSRRTTASSLPPEGRLKGSPNQWHLTAETVAPASLARFVTVLIPYREGGSPLPVVPIRENGCVGVRVGESLLLVPEHGTSGLIRYGRIEAQAAAIAIHEGRLLAAEVTELTLNGKNVVKPGEAETRICDAVFS